MQLSKISLFSKIKQKFKKYKKKNIDKKKTISETPQFIYEKDYNSLYSNNSIEDLNLCNNDLFLYDNELFVYDDNIYLNMAPNKTNTDLDIILSCYTN